MKIPPKNRPPAVFAGISSIIILGGLIASDTGLRINMSTSMPYGLWRTLPVPEKLERGMIVSACLSDPEIAAMALERRYVDPGTCSSGTAPLLKTIAAITGDFVEVTSVGVILNGTLIQNTVPLEQDPAGRPLPIVPVGGYRVSPGQVWLLSTTTPLDFDSRYLAAFPISTIQGIAHPVWTWK